MLHLALAIEMRPHQLAKKFWVALKLWMHRGLYQIRAAAGVQTRHLRP